MASIPSLSCWKRPSYTEAMMEGTMARQECCPPGGATEDNCISPNAAVQHNTIVNTQYKMMDWRRKSNLYLKRDRRKQAPAFMRPRPTTTGARWHHVVPRLYLYQHLRRRLVWSCVGKCLSVWFFFWCVVFINSHATSVWRCVAAEEHSLSLVAAGSCLCKSGSFFGESAFHFQQVE